MLEPLNASDRSLTPMDLCGRTVACAAFDEDKSGQLGLDEMRELVTMLHPAADKNTLRKAMLQVRTYCDASGQLDLDNFTDALVAVDTFMRQALGTEQYEAGRMNAAGMVRGHMHARRQQMPGVAKQPPANTAGATPWI